MPEERSAPSLMRQRRFLPLFLTQFLGALNDSFYKQAIFILITFRLAGEQGMDGPLLLAIGGGLFILPFFLFSATGGQFADKFEKSRLIRMIKIGEVIIMALAVIGFQLDDVNFLFAVLFLLGAQSAFFGPVKYSILPIHLRKHELIRGFERLADLRTGRLGDKPVHPESGVRRAGPSDQPEHHGGYLGDGARGP